MKPEPPNTVATSVIADRSRIARQTHCSAATRPGGLVLSLSGLARQEEAGVSLEFGGRQPVWKGIQMRRAAFGWLGQREARSAPMRSTAHATRSNAIRIRASCNVRNTASPRTL